MENDKRSVATEKPSEATVRENLVQKFGEKFANEPMVEVDGYFFYLDPIGRGDDMFKEYFLEQGNEEKRKNYLERSIEDFKVMARVLNRYKVSQEDFRGVGQWGSVQCFSFCHGVEEDKFGNKTYPDAKILFHKSYLKDKKIHFSFEGIKDIESFGVRVIDSGITKRVLDVGEEPIVKDVEIQNIFIEDITKRLEWWQSEYGMKNRELWQNLTDQLGSWLQEKTVAGSVDPELWIKLVLSKMDFVKVDSPDLPPAREEKWKSNEVIDTLRRSIKDVVDFVDVRESFINDEKSMESALSINERQLWNQIEDAFTGGQEIYVLEPSGLATLPAIYLLVQWAAMFYSGDENLAKKDIKDYWSRVKIVNKETLLSEHVNDKVLLVTGTSYDWDYDNDEVDKPEVMEIRAKLKDKLVIADIGSGKLR